MPGDFVLIYADTTHYDVNLPEFEGVVRLVERLHTDDPTLWFVEYRSRKTPHALGGTEISEEKVWFYVEGRGMSLLGSKNR